MNIEQARINMLKQQLRPNDILDDELLALINNTPREQFVPKSYQDLAFSDTHIPLEHEQVMLTPLQEAKILQALDIQKSDTVLEIGTGSGYMTALLAQLAKQVFSVDIFADFTAAAKSKTKALELHNITFDTADAAQGYPQYGPYDVIVITGSLPYLPAAFRQSLNPGGRLFAILGNSPAMAATLFTYTRDKKWHEQFLFETDVLPLVNASTKDAFEF